MTRLHYLLHIEYPSRQPTALPHLTHERLNLLIIHALYLLDEPLHNTGRLHLSLYLVLKHPVIQQQIEAPRCEQLLKVLYELLIVLAVVLAPVHCQAVEYVL